VAYFPKTVPELADILGVTTQELSFWAGSVERSVRLKKIPKPNGESRPITVPVHSLKIFLSRLDDAVLRKVLLHPLLYHRPGSSYLEMVKQHRKCKCLITADIDEFYPTVSPKKVLKSLLAEGFSEDAAMVITRLTTVSYSLPQGFPTSPTIAGIVLRPVGERLSGLSGACGFRIGLYADNLAISAKYNPRKFEGLIKRIFLQNGFDLDKWKVMTREDRQEIMNIVVNNGMSVKPEYREEVRRDIFMLSKLKSSDSNGDFPKQLKSVQGKLNHIRSVNTHQADVLCRYAKKLAVRI
jgi:RNA-directed DNA polymerase